MPRSPSAPRRNAYTSLTKTSLLKMASGQGHLEVVKLLVACGANPNDDGADDDDPDPESTRKAPLHMAAACGHTDVVRWLVREGGADARQCDRNGCNAYHLGWCRATPMW